MPTPIKTLPHVGDSWRNTETDESGIVVGYAPDAPYMGEDGKLYPTTSPVVKYDSGETLFGVTPQYTLPEVEVSGHLRTPADDLDSVFADVLTGGIASTEKMASDQLKEGINNGNWKDIFSGTATALSPLMFASGPARPFATTLFGADRLLVDPNGIQKTGRELLNGNYWNAAKSFAGDVFNGAIAGVGMYGMADDALNLAARLGSTDAKSIQFARALNRDIKGTELGIGEPTGGIIKTKSGNIGSNDSEMLASLEGNNTYSINSQLIKNAFSGYNPYEYQGLSVKQKPFKILNDYDYNFKIDFNDLLTPEGKKIVDDLKQFSKMPSKSLSSTTAGKPFHKQAAAALQKADNDIEKMNVYHDANVAEYNQATNFNVESVPFRTDRSNRTIKILPESEFLEEAKTWNTNSPVDDVRNIGGVYSKRSDTVTLKNGNNHSPSNDYHEFLHSNYYGETNPEVTEWRINQLIDPKKVAKLDERGRKYYLSDSEFPVHLRQFGESKGIEVGQPYPGDLAFDTLMFNSEGGGFSGASSFCKGASINSPSEDKQLLWRALNGTLFGTGAAVAGYGLYDSFNSTNSDVHAYGGPLYKQWQDLSIKEKADMIKVGVKNGLTKMSDIRQKYNEFANGGNLYAPGGWRDIAKYHIRRNEGFRQHSYADAPKGKSWRSVGYGFNDSGFYSKYPMGISKYYDSRGGITRQEAEQELDYMLNIMENQARRAYGSRWDQFNDNQKAAIMDTMYQRPASVLKGSQFYKAIMAGDPNAGNYLGVTGYANRNNIRRGLFGNPQIAVPQEQQLQMQQPLIIPYESLNIQALNTPQTTQQPIIDPEAQRKQQELEERQQALAERALAAENRQRGMENLAMAWRMLNEDTSSTDTSNSMPNMFTNNLYSPYNQYSLLAEGGNLYAAGGKRNIYDILPELYAMDGVNVVLSSGLRPNAVVYQNGKPTGRKSRHSSGQAADIVPGKGSTFADMLRVLRDPNSNVSRWMRANGAGFIDETRATGTTKYWHRHNRDYSHIHHQLGGAPASQYANMFKNIPLQQEPQQIQPVFMPVMTDPVLASYQKPVQQPQPLVDEATQKALLEQQERETALAEKQQAAIKKQHNMQMFANVYDLLYNSGNNSSNTPTTYTAPNGNPFRFAAYGGEIKTK